MPVEGKPPPHDLETEAAILSAVFARGASVVDEIRAVISPEDFYSESHRRICEACISLADAGQTVDMISVAGWLRDQNRLAQVGGVEYIATISTAAPVVLEAHLVTWATRIRAKARQRRLILRLRESLARAYSTSDHELESMFDEIESAVSSECSERHTGGFARIGNVLQSVMASLEHAEKCASEGRTAGIPTGFDRLDAHMSGLHEGDLTVVAARPGMGKTSLVTGLLTGVAERGYAGALFSCEMPNVQIGARALFSTARIDLQRGRAGRLGQNDWSKLTMKSSELSQLEIHLDDTAGITLAQIRSRLRKLVSDFNRRGKRLGIVVIDYLQICDLQEERGETRDGAIGRFTRGIKRLAKELAVPVVLLSQLNRGPESREDKRPRISDLRESGSIENDADNIVFIYRDDYYNKESPEPNVAELIIEKQRNGPTGVVKLGFDKASTAFFNFRSEWDDDESLTPPPGRFSDE